jgi:hypothetical protein
MMRYKSLYFLSFFALIWVAIFLSTNIYSSGFNYFLDDHYIVDSYYNHTGFKEIFLNPFLDLFPSQDGRLRPIYWVLLHFFSQLYGLNSFVWYLSSLMAAIITTYLFYIFAKRLHFSSIGSTCFALLTSFGVQASTYARFGTPETSAMLFTSLALVLATLNIKRPGHTQSIINLFFVIFAVLAALNKEACILMLPALGFLKVWSFSRDQKMTIKNAIIANWHVISLLSGILIALIAYIKLLGVSGPGYASLDNSIFSLDYFSGLFQTLLKRTPLSLSIAINIVVALSLILRRHSLRIENPVMDSLGFYCLSFLIIIPQLFLYSKSGIDNHYLFPSVIGVSMLTIFPLEYLRKNSSIFFKVFIVLAFLVASQQVFTTYRYFQNLSLSWHLDQEFVKDLSFCSSQGKTVVVIGNPYIHYERLWGLKTAVMNLLNKNQNVFLGLYFNDSSLAEHLPFVFSTKRSSEEEKRWSFLKVEGIVRYYAPKTLNLLEKDQLDKVSAIVVFNYNSNPSNQEFMSSTHNLYNNYPSNQEFMNLTHNLFDLKKFNYKHYPGYANVDIYCRN